MAISKVVRWRNASPDAPQYIASRIEETCQVELLRDVAVVPLNLEIRTHRVAPTKGVQAEQATQRILTTIRSNIDAQVYVIEQEHPGASEANRAAPSAASTGEYTLQVLANAGEVVPYLAGKDSPFVRQAKPTEQPEDGFRNVANMTASSLALPGTKKVPAPSNAQAAGPQLIPGQAAIVSGFQYSIKLAGKNSDVEWMVRLFLANSNSRGQAAIAAPGFGAVVQVVYCPIEPDALPDTASSEILDAFLASLFPVPSAFSAPDQLRMHVTDELSMTSSEWEAIARDVAPSLARTSSDMARTVVLLLRAIRRG